MGKKKVSISKIQRQEGDEEKIRMKIDFEKKAPRLKTRIRKAFSPHQTAADWHKKMAKDRHRRHQLEGPQGLA